jgi:hypothetical protein
MARERERFEALLRSVGGLDKLEALVRGIRLNEHGGVVLDAGEYGIEGEEPPPVPVPKRNPGGAPPKYDWAWIEPVIEAYVLGDRAMTRDAFIAWLRSAMLRKYGIAPPLDKNGRDRQTEKHIQDVRERLAK